MDTRVVIKKKLRIETKESFFSDFFLSFFFLSSKKKTTKTKIYFFAAQLRLSMALTTCRDGWLGFLFRWRTQQSAISGINCRITQLPNLWTQMAPGRSPQRPTSCMPYSQCRTKTQNYFKRVLICVPETTVRDRVVTPSPRHNVDSWVIHFLLSQGGWWREVWRLSPASLPAFLETTNESLETPKKEKNLFCYRPECGRVTRRT